MVVKTYTKKPVEVQAMKYDGTLESANAIVAWAQGHVLVSIKPASLDGSDKGGPVLECFGPYDAQVVHEGDYVVRGVEGEFYPCPPNIFAASYSE